jgi:hypothetical protein
VTPQELLELDDPPFRVGLGQRDTRQDPVEHQLVQLVLVGSMGVQRCRPRVQCPCDPAHADRLDTLRGQDLERRLHDQLLGKLRFRLSPRLAMPWRVRYLHLIISVANAMKRTLFEYRTSFV